jgi:hypothetical protein
MTSPDVAVALALIVCAGAITFGGIHYLSGVAEVLPKLGPQFQNRDYARYFFLDTVVWDRVMPHTARCHYMLFLIYMCISFACMLGVTLLQGPLTMVFIAAGLLSVCAGHMITRWIQYRDKL